MLENRKRKVYSVLGFLFIIVWIKTGVLHEDISYRKGQSIFTNDLPTGEGEMVNYFNKSLHGQGVILYLKGGIGNQLFEYACSYALARDLKRPLYNFIETSNITALLSEDRQFMPLQRDFALDKFEIPLTNFFDKSTAINHSRVSYLNDIDILFRKYPDNSFLEPSGVSYCQSISYWTQYKEEILSMFQLRPEIIQKFPPYVGDLAKEIETSEESVAMHVRRGDFVHVTGFYIPISFQRSGIRRVLKILEERGKASPKFFVFSDDIEYAREKLADLANYHEFVFVSYFPEGVGNRTTSIQDFFLMTKCKHFIIPNSTFAWWAAYLSTEWGVGKTPKSEKIVIASAFNPTFWRLFKTPEELAFYRMLHGQLYHPRNWIIINPFVGEH